MKAHIPYEQIRERRCDFIVKYKFYAAEEDGRKTGPPFQGYRCDFKYAGEENLPPAWMIWPEFLNENKSLIMDTCVPVPIEGLAQMWIIDPSMRQIHKTRVHIGTKGYFVEGMRKVAECEVIELVDLINITA